MNPVQKQSLYLKTLFFLFFIGLGISSPYFGIFYKHVLVSADGTPAIGLIGLIFFVMPLVSLVANIPAGILADKFHSGKHLITTFCFGVSLFALLIGLIGEDFARHWSVNGKFIYIFVLLFFLNCFFYPIMPMLDAETLLFLNKHFRREFYGVYRLWGTYGWSVSSILMGLLLFYFRHDPLIFYCAALAFAVLGFSSWSGIEARPAAAPIIIPWDHLKKDILFRWFLLFIFLHGVVTTSSFTYTGYFFDDVLKTPLEIGLILGTWAIFEIPVMMFSRELIDRFGNRWLIVSGLLLSGIRLILFSYFTLEAPFVWKWAAALLHGPGFGLSQLGIIDFVDRRAHPAMRATYLSIATVARMSLASALGGILGSMVIEQWGGAFLMKFCGWVTIAMIVFFTLLFRRYDQRGKSD
jgi:MFS transporter, PPP family, 3-phenylpropionic acid transporter